MNAGKVLPRLQARIRTHIPVSMAKAATTVGGRVVEEADTPAKPSDYVIKGDLRLVSVVCFIDA